MFQVQCFQRLCVSAAWLNVKIYHFSPLIIAFAVEVKLYLAISALRKQNVVLCDTKHLAHTITCRSPNFLENRNWADNTNTNYVLSWRIQNRPKCFASAEKTKDSLKSRHHHHQKSTQVSPVNRLILLCASSKMRNATSPFNLPTYKTIVHQDWFQLCILWGRHRSRTWRETGGQSHSFPRLSNLRLCFLFSFRISVIIRQKGDSSRLRRTGILHSERLRKICNDGYRNYREQSQFIDVQKRKSTVIQEVASFFIWRSILRISVRSRDRWSRIRRLSPSASTRNPQLPHLLLKEIPSGRAVHSRSTSRSAFSDHKCILLRDSVQGICQTANLAAHIHVCTCTSPMKPLPLQQQLPGHG